MTPPENRPDDQHPSVPVILLAEDDVLLRGLLVTQLQEAGYLIVEATSGPEALDQLRTLPVHVILADLNLPGCDGFEAIALHKFTHPNSPTRLVLMTGDHRGVGSLSIQDLCSLFGIHRRLDKPFELAELMKVVREEVDAYREATVT